MLSFVNNQTESWVVRFVPGNATRTNCLYHEAIHIAESRNFLTIIRNLLLWHVIGLCKRSSEDFFLRASIVNSLGNFHDFSLTDSDLFASFLSWLLPCRRQCGLRFILFVSWLLDIFNLGNSTSLGVEAEC